MLLAEAGCVFMSFILYVSEVQGQANSICALKGSSVELPCSAEENASSMKWYREGSARVQRELSADGNRITYNMSEGSNCALTIKGVNESDADFYCCRKVDQPDLCWSNGTQLHVADLQVKVIPSTEGHTVTLMCSTSCPLTENPAAYIWYKNREFLYQDWSPWYQHLVSSEEAVRYSCAIKGYEDLRAPEVSVDSVTPACFTVSYAKGRMCSHEQTSEDEPCSITYPREVHITRTHARVYDTLTCDTSCPAADPQTAYRWYWNRLLYSHCESQDVTLFRSSSEIFSCAVKGNEDLRSDENCLDSDSCWSVNYASWRICALEGSSVNISSEYSQAYNQNPGKIWKKVKRRDEKNAEVLIEEAGRVEYHDDVEKQHVLRISNLQRNDSAEYTFRLQRYDGARPPSDLPGVTLVVTGLKVAFTPSAAVTEGQRVTLTCSTSCPLTENYTWYLNSRPLTLPEDQNKLLVLDPVSSQHAGNYSCAVKTGTRNIISGEKTLTVSAFPGKPVAVLNAVKLILVLPAVFFLYLMMRKKKTLSSAAELSDKVQTGQVDSLNDNIALMAMTPAAQTEPAEQQDDTV